MVCSEGPKWAAVRGPSWKAPLPPLPQQHWERAISMHQTSGHSFIFVGTATLQAHHAQHPFHGVMIWVQVLLHTAWVAQWAKGGQGIGLQAVGQHTVGTG